MAQSNRPRASRITPHTSKRASLLGIGLAVVAVISLVAAFTLQRGQSTSTQPTAQAAPGEKMAPLFTLPATTGGTVSLESFRGKENVVLFWYEHAG